MTIRDLRGQDRDVSPIRLIAAELDAGLLRLRCDELPAAHFAPVDPFRRKAQPTDGVSYIEFVREKERQEVFLMLLQPDSKDPKDRLFRSVDELRSELDLDDVKFVQAEYEKRVLERLRALGVAPEAQDE